MIKTNCEIPLCMYNHNYELNDYDFVLYHLYTRNKRYNEYYKAMRRIHPDRIMILDNSAYEMFIKGETLNLESYKNVIEELNPTYYILPDVLMDKDTTINDTKEFLSKYRPDCCSEPLAVVQGNTAEELLECMDIYKSMGIKNICIPFHNSFFKDSYDQTVCRQFKSIYNNITNDIRYAAGRVSFVLDNIEKIRSFKYVHMLGSHCPYEKCFYYDLDSMDTGYPVKLGLNNEKLGEESKKPEVIIDDFLDKPISFTKRHLIETNIRLFKTY